MNETEWIFTGIASFGLGYAIAYFFKNMGNLLRKWGWFLSYFLFPLIILFFLGSSAMLADLKDTVLSLLFGAGFLFKLLR